jgi:hypothetical protein
MRQVNLINFGVDLRPDTIQLIEKDHDVAITVVNVKASLNLKKHSTYIQVHDLVKLNAALFKEEFILNLPGLPIFAAFLISELHALTGKFPVILECVKNYDTEGVFGDLQYKRLYNCERERNQSREDFKGVTS